MRIGIDIGNVIIGGGTEDTSFFTDDYLATPEVKGSYESVQKLSKDHELHWVSKCGPEVEKKTLLWLEVCGWLYYIRLGKLHFVRKRHLKAPMAQALELDIFIDDRQDIIDSLQGIVPYPILFTSWEETNRRLEEIWNSLKKET